MQIYQEEFQRKTTFSLTFPFLSHLQTRNIGFSHLFFCIIQRHRKGIYFMRRNFEHRIHHDGFYDGAELHPVYIRWLYPQYIRTLPARTPV